MSNSYIVAEWDSGLQYTLQICFYASVIVGVGEWDFSANCRNINDDSTTNISMWGGMARRQYSRPTKKLFQ